VVLNVEEINGFVREPLRGYHVREIITYLTWKEEACFPRTSFNGCVGACPRCKFLAFPNCSVYAGSTASAAYY